MHSDIIGTVGGEEKTGVDQSSPIEPMTVGLRVRVFAFVLVCAFLCMGEFYTER